MTDLWQADRSPDGGEDGFSLLMVLLIVLAIATILAPLAAHVKTGALQTNSVLRVSELQVLAQGISLALVSEAAHGATAEISNPLAANSTLYRCEAGQVEIKYALQDHAGLIDLNLAPNEVLEGGFRSLGFDLHLSERLASAVASFRQFKVNNVGNPDLAIVGGLKNAPYDSVSELFDILDVRRVPLWQINRTFTTYSGTSHVASELMPRPLAGYLPVDADPSFAASVSQTGSERPLTASVTVHRGGLEGNFVGVYRPSARSAPRLLEIWRYDFRNRAAEAVDEGSCETRFGSGFTELVEGFV